MVSASDVPRLAIVELADVRGFERLTLTLAPTGQGSQGPMSPRGRVAVVIGRNGTNKSTLLRSIALGVGSHGDAAAMLSAELGSLVRTGASEARIRG